jgi:hypothetical protein
VVRVLVFSPADFINIVVSIVGGEGLGHLAEAPAGGVRWMRRIARRVADEAAPIAVDRAALERIIVDVDTWKTLAARDPAAAEGVVTLFSAAVVAPVGAAHDDACRRVATIMATEVEEALSLLDLFALRTYGNTEQTLEDLGALAVIGLDLHDRLDDVASRMADIVRSSSHEEVLGRFAGASPTDGRATSSFAAVLLGALAIHRGVSDALGPDDGDIWLIDDFPEVVLEGLVPSLLPLVEASSNPDERLLAHVVLLYVDAVLRVEASVRLGAIEQPDGASPLLQVDLARAAAVSPDIVGRRERARSAGDSTVVLDHWLAHQAAVLSPTTWEGWAARDLASAMAALVEGREDRRDEAADLLRRLGRHAAFDVDHLPADRRALRPDGGAHAVLTMSPRVTGALTRLFWKAYVDPRRTGQRLAEQLGLRTEFPLADAVSDLRAALWTVDDLRMELDAACAHPATALALEEHVTRLGAELAEMARTGPLASLRERSVSGRRLRAREVDGRPVFETPLVQLELAQDEVRRLLMGDALYGNPELAVRELYQNALDACRYRSLRSRYRALSAAEQAYEPSVSIVQDRVGDGLEIRCTDNGVGMSYVELRDAFTKAGRRFTDLPGFQDEQARWLAADASLKLHPNSRFGIGVFSYFMLADEVIIDTVHERPDGTLDRPLHVSIPASSGLLTISSPAVPPPEIAAGGTMVTLVLPPEEQGQDRVRHLSVVRVLEELVWSTEISLLAEDDRGRSREWDPSTLRRGDGHVAFEVDGCTAWWTEGAGGVLADGIKTDIDLTGVVVSLTGLHAPRLSVDRNTVLAWDEAWVDEQLRAAAPEVFAWDRVTMSWLWRLAHHWPAVGQAIYEVAAAEDHHVRIDASEDDGATSVPLRRLGLFPYDIRLLRLGQRLDNPLPRAPDAVRDDEFGEADPQMPTSLTTWRLATAEALGVRDIMGRPRRTPRLDPEALIVGDPFLSAGVTGLDRGIATYRKGTRVCMTAADQLAIVVGAARTGSALPSLARRVRQLHACGVGGPFVDIRRLADPALDRSAALILATIRAMDTLGGRRPLHWFTAAVVAAADLRRPVSSFAPMFEALQALGLTELPDLSGCVHVPTPGEVAILYQRDLGFNQIVANADQHGFSDYSDILELLTPYRSALESCGCAVADLERVQELVPDDEEAIAWSEGLNGSWPWIYFQAMDVNHVAKVAQRLSLSLPEAHDVVRRAPGVVLPRRPASDVSRSVIAILASGDTAQRPEWDNTPFSVLARARSRGLDPAELEEAQAVERQRRPRVVDWAAVSRFTPDHVLRHLLTGGRSDRSDLNVNKIGPDDLLRTAENLHIGLRDVARRADRLEPLGIRLRYARPVPDVMPVRADLDRVQAAMAGRSGLIGAFADEGRWPGFDHLRDALPWCRWVWDDDPITDQVIAVIDELADRNTPVEAQAVHLAERLEAIAEVNGGISRAHIIEVCGAYGMPGAELREELGPFEPLFAARGWPIPWLPDGSAETTIGWLDVAVVGLLVAREPVRRHPDDELRSFVLGNIDAEEDAVHERIDRWLPLLAEDPGSSFIPVVDLRESQLVSGMVRWPVARS